MANCNWEILPHSLLVYVFTFLPIKDRRNASECCQSWYNAFQSPQLWRCLTCKFISQPAPDVSSTAGACVNANAIPIVLHSTKSLKYLRIEWTPDLWANEEGRLVAKFPMEMTLLLSEFFEALIKTEAIPQLYGLYLTCSWTLPLIDKTVDDTTALLEAFLESQKRLRHFYIDWQLNAVNGISVIRSLSLHCSESLIELNIQKCISSFSQRNPNWLIKDLALYTQLSTLQINYFDLTENLLKTVSKACLTLRDVGIVCSQQLVKPNSLLILKVSCATWIAVKHNLPNLRVSYVLHNANWNIQIFETVIPRAVPLKSLSVSFFEPKTDCITYLQYFAATLEEVFLDLEVDPSILKLEQQPEEINTVTLVEFFKYCTRLQTFKAIGKLPLDILDEVFTLKFDKKIGLKNFNITFLSLSDAEETRLDYEIDKFNTLSSKLKFTIDSTKMKQDENFEEEASLNLEQVNNAVPNAVDNEIIEAPPARKAFCSIL